MGLTRFFKDITIIMRRTPRFTKKFRKEERKMFSYIWPIGLVVISNTVYQLCSKSVPQNMDPFASLTVTYALAAVFCLAMFFIMNKDGSIVEEYKKLNWAPIVQGIIVVGLEIGFIYAYKAGWQVSTASIVQSAFLAVSLLITGFLIYREELSANKIMGVVICLIGLYFINK